MLHGPDLRALHVQGDRLDGFPLQSAHLTRHVPIEALTRLLAGEAIGKLGMMVSRMNLIFYCHAVFFRWGRKTRAND
jgi:hypothetical protein